MKLMKSLKGGQSGIALVMALIMLALSALVVVPILNMAATSLNYNQVVQRNTLETYSADSGVEFALCEIGNEPELYQTETLQDSFTLNDRTVDVTAEYMDNNTYKITSNATTDSSSSTTIESYVTYSPYPALFGNGINSRGDVTIQPHSNIYGDVQYEGTLVEKGNIHGDKKKTVIEGWPEVDDLNQFYWVESPVISDSIINISSGTELNPYIIGPARASGNLEIQGEGGVAELHGTLFVEGYLDFKPKTIVKLNGKTVYVQGHIIMSPDVSMYGPGCIISVGDMDYKPHMLSGEGAYVFLMSVTGTVNCKPENDFYGSVNGNIAVNVEPHYDFYADEPPAGLNFPGSNSLEIISYEIK